MQVGVSYSIERFNQFNDASEGWERRVEVVSIDDGGEMLGKFIVGLLAAGAVVESVGVMVALPRREAVELTPAG